MARKTRHIRAGNDEWVVVHRERQPQQNTGGDYSWLWIAGGVLFLLLIIPGWVWALLPLVFFGYVVMLAILR